MQIWYSVLHSLGYAGVCFRICHRSPVVMGHELMHQPPLRKAKRQICHSLYREQKEDILPHRDSISLFLGSQFPSCTFHSIQLCDLKFFFVRQPARFMCGSPLFLVCGEAKSGFCFCNDLDRSARFAPAITQKSCSFA